MSYQQQPPVMYAPPRPTKDRTAALLIELIPAFFGFYGFGWMYSGNVAIGLLWLIGVFIWLCIAGAAAALTSGIALVCICPINLILFGATAFSLYGYTKSHPETFGA